MMTPGTIPDGNAHHELVTGFRNPDDAWRSMGKIHPGEQITEGVFTNRHARRAKRNAHRIAIAKDVLLYGRSQDGHGAEQAARVANITIAPSDDLLARLSGASSAPAEQPKRGFLGMGGTKN